MPRVHRSRIATIIVMGAVAIGVTLRADEPGDTRAAVAPSGNVLVADGDSAVIEMDWDRELRAALDGVAALADSGFDAPSRERIMEEVLADGVKHGESSSAAPSRLSYYLVLWRAGAPVPFHLVIETRDIGTVTVRARSAETVLMAGVRTVLANAWRVSLEPLGRTGVWVAQRPAWRDTPARLVLDLATDEQYGSPSDEIAHSLQRYGNTLSIAVDGILPARGPVPASGGPARGEVPLSLLPGRYQLLLHYRGDTSAFVLWVGIRSARLRTRRAGLFHAEEQPR